MSDFGFVVFIRHKLDASNAIMEDFWNKGIIGIHYENKCSFDADDYTKLKESTRKTLKSHFKLMAEMQEKGALVVAEYHNPFNTDKKKDNALLIGIIEQGTEKTCKEYIDDNGEEVIYKIMKMKNKKVIYYEDYPILLSCKPPYTTMCKWHMMKKKIPSIYYGKPLPEEVNSLTFSELEVICYEFLKIEKLDCLLLPIGRTLDKVDIAGLNRQGNRLFAQVTFSKKVKTIENKVKELLKVKKSENSDLYFFGPKSVEKTVKENNKNKTIKFKAIEDVFDELKSKKETKKAIDIMLNI